MGFSRSYPVRFFEYLGDLFYLFSDFIHTGFSKRWRFSLIFQQISEIGFFSQPMVWLTGAFTGGVLTTQSISQFRLMNVETLTGALTSLALMRELAPVITGLMIAGRVGTAMAAEIGTMKISEQLDALKSMNVNVVEYLIFPRVLSITFCLPFLVLQSALVGIGVSYILSVFFFQIPSGYWIHHMQNFTSLSEVSVALIKGTLFGFLIGLISCHQGIISKNSTKGVARGTTHAMVFSSVAILISNFFSTMLLNNIFPIGK